MSWIDWYGAIAGLLGAIIVWKDVRVATIVWITSNIALIVWGIYTHTYSIFTMQVGYLIINSITIAIRWRRP